MKPKHSLKYLTPYRRALRKKSTPAERYLWKHLKNKQLNGARFQRQHSINNYIVDFYCANSKLIIELDGEIHNNATALEKDEKRDRKLEDLGYKVLRFENKMVFENLTDVIGWITEEIITD